MIQSRFVYAVVPAAGITSESVHARPGDNYQLEIAIVSSLRFASE